MNADRFDTLARTLRPGSRRQALRLLTGTVLAGLLAGGSRPGTTREAMAKERKKKPPAGAAPGPCAGAQTLTQEGAERILTDAGVSTAPGECTDPQNKTCTSFEGLRRSAAEGIVAFAQACGCTPVVTGGTERGHFDQGNLHPRQRLQDRPREGFQRR